MAAIRGGTVLWNAVAIVNGDASVAGNIGANTAVAVLIKNSGANAATFVVEVSGEVSPQAGRNFSPTDWYQYISRADATPESFVVASGSNVGIDLSPFAPSFLRLKCTANTGGTTVTALLVSNA